MQLKFKALTIFELLSSALLLRMEVVNWQVPCSLFCVHSQMHALCFLYLQFFYDFIYQFLHKQSTYRSFAEARCIRRIAWLPSYVVCLDTSLPLGKCFTRGLLNYEFLLSCWPAAKGIILSAEFTWKCSNQRVLNIISARKGSPYCSFSSKEDFASGVILVFWITLNASSK